MVLKIHIRLLSGKTISVEAELHELVEALTRRARKSLAVAGLVLIKELTLSYHNRIYCGDYSSLSG